MKRILCWLVRLSGGSHQWRRVRKIEFAVDDIARAQARKCNRCGATRFVKTRNRKPKEM